MIKLPSPNILFQPKNHAPPNAPRLPNNSSQSNPNRTQAFTPRHGRPTPRFKTPYRKYTNNQTYNRANAQAQLEHWCETCDRGFRSALILEEHKSEHQICGIDGCKFFAHPKIVTNHIQMQHSTGLYNRIRNLESPEDIANWVKERKKNYPSKENIEKKKAQIDECIDRGEKIRDKKSRFNDRKQSKFSQRNDRKNKLYQKRKERLNNGDKVNISKSTSTINQPVKVIKMQVEEENESYCGVEPFKGISTIVWNDIMNDETNDVADNLNIEDAEWNDKSKDTCIGLSSLVAAYGSCDEESENEVKDPISLNSNQSSVICTKGADSDDSAPEEITVKRTDDIQEMIAVSVKLDNNVDKVDEKPNRKRGKNSADTKNESQNSTNKKSKRPPNAFEQQIKYYKERPSTLLEKLLEKDIKHERNVLLQCINYIAKNNFFDK